MRSPSRRRRHGLAVGLASLTLTVACAKGDPPPQGQPNAPHANAPAAATADGAAEAPPARVLPPAEELLDKAAAAVGTPEAIAGLESFYYRSTIEMEGLNIHGDLQIWWKKGDFFMEQVVPGFGEMRAGKLGDELWSEDPINGRRKLSGIEAEQLAWASSLLLAADWDEFFDTANTIDERTDDGRTVYDVALSSASGLTAVLSFDAESGLQVGQSYDQMSPMGTQPFSTKFKDFREVDGIKLAFEQVIDTKVQVIIQRITEVRLNVDIDESGFGYPRTGDVVRQPKAG